MLQKESPSDYVIATGRKESVRRFIEIAANSLGWNKSTNSSGIVWEGEGLREIGRRADTGKIVIRIDQKYFRLTEVPNLLGDSTLARDKLGWVPKTTLEELISEMVKVDKEEAQKELVLVRSGFEIKSRNEDI